MASVAWPTIARVTTADDTCRSRLFAARLNPCGVNRFVIFAAKS